MSNLVEVLDSDYEIVDGIAVALVSLAFGYALKYSPIPGRLRGLFASTVTVLAYSAYQAATQE